MSWNIGIPDAEWYAPGDQRMDGLVREVLDQDVVSLDTETTGLNVMRDTPLFWSMAWGEHRRICMPIATATYFKESFKDATKRWVFANAKFDMHMMKQVGVDLAGDCVDTAVMHALIYEEESHALKDMAKEKLGWKWSDFFEAFRPLMVPDMSKPPKLLRDGSYSQPTRKEFISEMLMRYYHNELPKLVDYASNDAYGTLMLYNVLRDELERTKIFSLYPEDYPTMEHLFFKTEVPFTKVLWNCERNGIHVSREYLDQKKDPMVGECNRLRYEMQKLARDAGMKNALFNPNSTTQLRQYFFGLKNLKALMYTKGGKSGIKEKSVDKGFLEHYADEGEPMAEALIEFRKMDKLLGTYIEGANDHLDENERIHTKFNQDVARTGRLSSSDPNLQNIPKPESDKFQLRGAFQAIKGHTLIVGDYEQLEMRLLACATVTKQNPLGARDMIQIFLDGKDIHMGNAAMVYGPLYKDRYGWELTYDFLKESKKLDGKVKAGDAPPEALTERHHLALFARNAIKSVGFGLNYGMKEKKLARQLGISEDAARDIIKSYLGAYPAVNDFYAAAIKEAQEDGFSYTLLGRRRAHIAINSNNTMDRWSEERKATNNTIQGTAADAVRLAMLACARANLEYKYGCRMLLQIHDELIFECPDETAQQAKAEIKAIMEHPFKTDLAVPLTVSIGTGPSWNKAK